MWEAVACRLFQWQTGKLMRFVKLVFETTTTNFTVGKVLWESRPTDALYTKIIGLLNKYIHKIDANLFVKK